MDEDAGVGLKEVSLWRHGGRLPENGAGREQGSSGKEYARSLYTSKLPALGHSVCFFVDVAMEEELGRACSNHAVRHRLITTAKSMLFSKVASSLYSKLRLENAPRPSPRYRSL